MGQGRVALKVNHRRRQQRRVRRTQVATATDEAIRKAVGRKVYGYSLDDSNGTQLLLFEVKDHMTSDSDGSVGFGDEKGASP